jgi:hypothetical protein
MSKILHFVPGSPCAVCWKQRRVRVGRKSYFFTCLLTTAEKICFRDRDTGKCHEICSPTLDEEDKGSDES